MRAQNISIMKRLHWFDKKEAEEKKFKGRRRLGWKRRRKLDKTFLLRRKRESELERKSDNNNQIPVPAKTYLHSSILHSTTEHTRKLC